MIKIKLDDENLSLTITGHADYAEYGKDIVCAGVSSLVQTLALYAEKHGGRANMSGGNAEIDCPHTKEAREVFKCISDGLRGIAMSYGEFVWFT